MINEGADPDSNDGSVVESCRSEARSAAQQTPKLDAKNAVLSWSSFFLVQRSSPPGSADAVEHPVLLPPNQETISQLESLEEIQSVWFVRLTKEGLLSTERIDHVCNWRLFPDPDGRYVNALLCSSGAVFIVSEDLIYEVDEVTRRWFSGGKFMTAKRLQSAFLVETVVLAKRNEGDVVTVRSVDGLIYSVSRHTVGVTLEALEEGMRVQCLVSRQQRVLGASVIGPASHETLSADEQAS
jgi:hypothetical protein